MAVPVDWTRATDVVVLGGGVGGRDRVSGCWETATGANIGEVNPGRPGYDGLDMV